MTTSTTDWLTGLLTCKDEGGKGLAKVESADENRVVQELLGKESLVTISFTCPRHDRRAGGLDRAAGLH